VRATDIDSDAVVIGLFAMNAASAMKVAPCNACAGQRRCREMVGDHDVIADFDGERDLSMAIAGEYAALRIENSGKLHWQSHGMRQARDQPSATRQPPRLAASCVHHGR
jgi:hypothetical protein